MKLKLGSLVTSGVMGDNIGIIISQVGLEDRWVILWTNGNQTMFWGKSLEAVTA